MPTIADRVAARIRQLRTSRGWTQERLAEVADMSRDGLARIERGDREARLESLEKLADALDVSVADLFDRKRPPRLRMTKSDRLRRIERHLSGLDDAAAERVVRAVAALAKETAPQRKKRR